MRLRSKLYPWIKVLIVKISLLIILTLAITPFKTHAEEYLTGIINRSNTTVTVMYQSDEQSNVASITTMHYRITEKPIVVNFVTPHGKLLGIAHVYRNLTDNSIVFDYFSADKNKLLPFGLNSMKPTSSKKYMLYQGGAYGQDGEQCFIVIIQENGTLVFQRAECP
jgi:hypothetical protein